MSVRSCAWCRGPLPAGARRDAITCSKRCRQARQRFTSSVGRVQATLETPLRLAYADPPYPGMSGYYRGHPDYAGEVDHEALIRRLSLEYDGWALSTSHRTLWQVYRLCPPEALVAVWIRGPRRDRAAGPVNAWEPVIYCGGRRTVALEPIDPSLVDESDTSRTWSTRRIDVLHYTARPRLTDPARVIGAKPAGFARWLFELLGALPQDRFDDLYPGSGGIARAWASYSSTALAAEVTPDGRTAS